MTQLQRYSTVAFAAALVVACDPDDGGTAGEPDAGGTAAVGTDDGGDDDDAMGPDDGGPDDDGVDDGGPGTGDEGDDDDGEPDDGPGDDADGDTAGADSGSDDGGNAACAGEPSGHALGNVAANWTLTDGDGNDVSLHDYCGKVIFLEIGAEW